MTLPNDYNSLKQQIAHGNEQAFQQLYNHLKTPLFRVARQYVPVFQAAEEIVADAFIMLWEKRHEVSRIEDIRWYLYTSVRNRSLNWVRQQKAKSYMPLSDTDVEYTWDNNPENLLITDETLAEINKAINELPPKCREIFVLVKEDRLKYKKVAELLGVSIKTVENQLSIALKKLYFLLEHLKK